MKNLIVAIAATSVSVIANLFILFLGMPYATEFMPMNPGPVIIFSVTGAIGATAVYFIVKRFSKNPKPLYVKISIAALILSLIPDIMMFSSVDPRLGVATPIGIISLMVMHIAEAGIMVYSFLKFTD